MQRGRQAGAHHLTFTSSSDRRVQAITIHEAEAVKRLPPTVRDHVNMAASATTHVTKTAAGFVARPVISAAEYGIKHVSPLLKKTTGSHAAGGGVESSARGRDRDTGAGVDLAPLPPVVTR